MQSIVKSANLHMTISLRAQHTKSLHEETHKKYLRI